MVFQVRAASAIRAESIACDPLHLARRKECVTLAENGETAAYPAQRTACYEFLSVGPYQLPTGVVAARRDRLRPI
jgi:hypothetical protein